KTVQVDALEAMDGTKNSFVISVYEQIHTDNSGNKYNGYEFRASDLGFTKDEYIILWVTQFENIYQNTMIEARGEQLRKKSLPEVLIYYASQFLQSDITSSSTLPNQSRYDIDKRHDTGQKVWDRLIQMK